MSFWGELKRRNVFKVGAVYVIVAWVILQAVSIIFPMLHLPSWTGTFVTVLILIGFPVTLIIAWAFELTADGVKRTSEVPHNESITHVTGRKINYVLGGLLVIAVALLIFDNYYLDRRVEQPEVASTAAERTPSATDVTEDPKTIAVLPFENLSSDPEQEYFVDGLSEEILNSLTKVPDLHVTSRTSSFYFKNTDTTIQKIAEVLNVSYILEGSVRKAENALRITAQLIRTADDRHLWSETYDRELKDIFAIQEDIATIVADKLKVTLGIDKSFKQLGGTDNVEAYQLYLTAKGKTAEDNISGYNSALQLLDAAIVLDPEFALAWAFKAYNYIVLTIHAPYSQSVTYTDAALSAAQKAIELEPNLASGYLMLGETNALSANFFDVELAFRKAQELNDESLSRENVGYVPYFSVGNFEKAHERLEVLRQYDPINYSFLVWDCIYYGLLGDRQRAEEEYQRRNKSLYKGFSDTPDAFITTVRLGSGDAVSRDEIVFSDPIFFTLKEYIDDPEKGLVELRRIYSSDENLSAADFQAISMWAAYFDDPEFAMDAMEKGVSVNASGLWVNWFPVMHEMRQLPRFKEFIREIGLVDYWNEFGWPDICQPTDDGDFVCD